MKTILASICFTCAAHLDPVEDPNDFVGKRMSFENAIVCNSLDSMERIARAFERNVSRGQYLLDLHIELHKRGKPDGCYEGGSKGALFVSVVHQFVFHTEFQRIRSTVYAIKDDSGKRQFAMILYPLSMV